LKIARRNKQQKSPE